MKNSVDQKKEIILIIAWYNFPWVYKKHMVDELNLKMKEIYLWKETQEDKKIVDALVIVPANNIEA